MAPKAPPKIELVNGRTVKNFKTFEKVLTLSQQRQNESLEGRSGNTFSGRKLTFEVYDQSGKSSSILTSNLDETRESIQSKGVSNDFFARAPSSSRKSKFNIYRHILFYLIKTLLFYNSTNLYKYKTT